MNQKTCPFSRDSAGRLSAAEFNLMIAVAGFDLVKQLGKREGKIGLNSGLSRKKEKGKRESKDVGPFLNSVGLKRKPKSEVSLRSGIPTINSVKGQNGEV